MSWLTWLWATAAATCGMSVLVHLFLWFHAREGRSYILPILMALAGSWVAYVEFRLMTAASVAEYQSLLLVANVFIGVLVVSTVWFIRSHLGTGRRFLALAISALWGGGLVLNFALPGSLTFDQLTALETTRLPWGEEFVVPEGHVSPWATLPNLASLLFAIFVIDAVVQAWRRGMRHKAVVAGGSIAVFIVLAGVHTPLVDAGVIDSPYMISFAFLAIVLGQTYSVARDAVTAKRLKKEVARGQRQWDAFMDTVNLVAIEVDNEGVTRYVNPHVERISGYSAEDVVGQPVSVLIEGQADDQLQPRLASALRDGPRPVSQWSLRCADGSRRNLVCSSVPLYDERGEIRGILSTGTDVTAQLSAQSDLRRVEREMDRLVRTSMLGELTSTLAHELNQPLAAILTNAQAALRLLAAEGVSSTELREILQDIVHDDKRAGEVIHGLRNILRNGQVVHEELRIEETVEEVIRLVRDELRAKQIQLYSDSPEPLPAVRASRVQLEQVLLNLILNATRALQTVPPEGRTLRIACALDDGMVEVRVTDSGPGIEDAILGSIFEPRFTTASSGLGVGLWISRRIVEAHGGGISVRNVEGNGAEFRYWIPAMARGEGVEHA